MPKRKDDKNANVELTKEQIALVKLATLSSGLSKLFITLATETDDKVRVALQDKINDTMAMIDNLITEELMGIDISKDRS